MTDQSSLSHRQTWDLIPWLVNGSASAADRTIAEEHLLTCTDCRDEYAFQSRLRAGMSQEPASIGEPHAALRRLLTRIDMFEDGASETGADDALFGVERHPARRRPQRLGEAHRYRILTAALIAQSMALLLLGAFVLQRAPSADPNAAYRTLSQPAPAEPAIIRFVPAPTLTVGALQAMLADVRLRIVESSRDGSIYGLAATAVFSGSDRPDGGAPRRDADIALAIDHLRAQPGVLLAEPIGAAAGAGR